MEGAMSKKQSYTVQITITATASVTAENEEQAKALAHDSIDLGVKDEIVPQAQKRRAVYHVNPHCAVILHCGLEQKETKVLDETTV
jgi:hypothetical protein